MLHMFDLAAIGLSSKIPCGKHNATVLAARYCLKFGDYSSTIPRNTLS